MASTNAFLTLYSTVQTNLVGSTIATGYIPYVSTAGRQAYTNTPQVSTLGTSAASLPLQVGGVTYATLTSSGLSGVTSPTVLFASGTSGTFVGTGYKTLWIRIVGGGGGGYTYGGGTAGTGNTTTVVGTGLSVGALTAPGGYGAGGIAAGQGGIAGTGNITIPGGNGAVGTFYQSPASSSYYGVPGVGGGTILGAGASGGGSVVASNYPAVNGGGGTGAGTGPAVGQGAGGGGGSYSESYISNPSGTYTVTIGSGGAGTTSTNAYNNGANGYCIAVGFY